MNIAVVGATGMVGETFLDILSQRDFPFKHLRLFASPKNQRKKRVFKSHTITLESLSEADLGGLDLVFFSAGEQVSQQWAPVFAKKGAFVIDNSSAFRMQKDIPLIVPEVNGHLLPTGVLKGRGTAHKTPALNKEGQTQRIIANPNCSTIQLVMVLQVLNKHFGLHSVHVSSYQAVSGAGRQALNQLTQESKDMLSQIGGVGDKRTSTAGAGLPVSSRSLAFNCIPQIGSLDESGFSTEELKLMRETKKILSLPDLKVTASAVRVPVLNGHGESVLLTLKKPSAKKEIISLLQAEKGVCVLEGDKWPHQRFVDGKDDVYVGRIRPVLEGGIADNKAKSYMLWIVADNVRKGAALNALQIAELLA